MKIKVNDFEIDLSERGIITLREENNEIFLGSYTGTKFEALLQALKSAKEIGYLSEIADKTGLSSKEKRGKKQ